ncbi:MAG: hypothetical protein WDN04_24900 [Rhodospirillales bacterium]
MPIAIIVVYAFSASNVQSWPIAAFSLRWFAVASADEEVRAAFVLSLQVASVATTLAVLLGTLAAMAVTAWRRARATRFPSPWCCRSRCQAF